MPDGLYFRFDGRVEGTGDISAYTSAYAETGLYIQFTVTGQPETLAVAMSGLSINNPAQAAQAAFVITLLLQNTTTTFVGPWRSGGPFNPGTVQVELPLGTHTISIASGLTQPNNYPGTNFVEFDGTFTFSNMVVDPGATQDHPILGVGNTFPATPGGLWFDPPLAQGYTFTYTGTGSQGFTDIMSFPSGIQGNYSVTTEGTTYGPFTPNQPVELSTLRGHAVKSFVLTGIKPFLDATSPVAFPIMLQFSGSNDNFTMVPIAAPDLQMVTLLNGDLQFTFDGVLQSSPDLTNWTDVTPTPTSPYVLPKALIGGSKFFRSSKP